MRFTLQRPDFGKMLAGTEKAIERAVTAGMRQASEGLKASLRQNVVSAGLGDRLARTWRGTTYPEAGESLEAAAFVWSRAPKLVDAFDRGVVIRSARGFWLAIPTPAAGAVGRTSAGRPARITPGGWERRTGLRLRFVYRRGRPSLLVAENVRLTSKGVAAPNRKRTDQASAVIFLLVPQVSLRKRLDIGRTGETWAARVPSLIARNWTLS